MLVHRRIQQVVQDHLYVSAEPDHRWLTGVPFAILAFCTLDSYRLRTQYTKSDQSLCVKEVSIRQSLITP